LPFVAASKHSNACHDLAACEHVDLESPAWSFSSTIFASRCAAP
jgi:hypothetical protein